MKRRLSVVREHHKDKKRLATLLLAKAAQQDNKGVKLFVEGEVDSRIELGVQVVGLESDIHRVSGLFLFLRSICDLDAIIWAATNTGAEHSNETLEWNRASFMPDRDIYRAILDADEDPVLELLKRCMDLVDSSPQIGELTTLDREVLGYELLNLVHLSPIFEDQQLFFQVVRSILTQFDCIRRVRQVRDFVLGELDFAVIDRLLSGVPREIVAMVDDRVACQVEYAKSDIFRSLVDLRRIEEYLETDSPPIRGRRVHLIAQLFQLFREIGWAEVIVGEDYSLGFLNCGSGHFSKGHLLNPLLELADIEVELLG